MKEEESVAAGAAQPFCVVRSLRAHILTNGRSYLNPRCQISENMKQNQDETGYSIVCLSQSGAEVAHFLLDR